MAISLRLLAGASHLDVATLFKVAYNYVYKLFQEVLQDWICRDSVAQFQLDEVIAEKKAMYDIAKKFAEGLTGGILAGVIGALDGWLVQIKSPSITSDKISNPGSYFSRKGFYALNVQVIVHRDKKILWRSINAKGSEHDSAAFKSTKLYKTLCEMTSDQSNPMLDSRDNLPFYLIGDSAYAIRQFLFTPYDNAKTGSPEDIYNYHHSSSRIIVECAFGDIDARWEIFWRPLKFPLCHHKFIIDACMRLHNFILEQLTVLGGDPNTDREYFSKECLAF